MIIQVTKTITEQKEINFPYISFNEKSGTYYYNTKENFCITITDSTISVYDMINIGLEYPEVKQEEVFKVMDQTILTITEALNK